MIPTSTTLCHSFLARQSWLTVMSHRGPEAAVMAFGLLQFLLTWSGGAAAAVTVAAPNTLAVGATEWDSPSALT
jgi:hypothetical protein